MERESLIALLEQVAAEHELYQQTELEGGHDEDWTTWYVHRLLEEESFVAAGWGADPRRLAEYLTQAFHDFAAEPRTGWAERIANRLLSKS